MAMKKKPGRSKVEVGIPSTEAVFSAGNNNASGSLVDSEMNQQVFILDLSFNPEITDELMVIYFDLNKEIFCITHES